ncbi:DUF3644 domain-containing protein [Yersinia enterocolitica]|uniref:DUF3644 domain-containing protein n=1 Tax=Yersinia enterocolitica TaxID=630 RepID=UPI003F432095|nr:DUF3644 domain-containing protein [Yersinia enterocolitica]EKN5117333.1 DUF3644 domain-containing protein [Yersinia enterocolitica]
MSKYEKIDLAYSFLIDKETQGETFKLHELSEASTWSIKTCTTHISKKLISYFQKEGADFITNGILFLSKNDFRSLLSQTSSLANNYSRKGILLTKSKEFALLAVTIYNNPTIKFKTYGFIINMIISYTSLFHAIFEKNGVDYYHKDRDGNTVYIDGEEKAWELKECFEKYWHGIESPVKSNLSFLIGLRNKIEHRFLPIVDLMCSGECQAALINYENLLTKEFGDNHALLVNLAVTMQLSRASMEAKVEALKQFQSQNYMIIRQFMESERQALSAEMLESQEYRIKAFLIPKIGNHAVTSDISIEFVNFRKLSEEEKAQYDQGIAFIKEVQSPYIHKPSDIVLKVKELHPFFNMALHTKCWKFFEARPNILNSTYKGVYAGFVLGFNNYLYTSDWIAFLNVELSNLERLQNIREV